MQQRLAKREGVRKINAAVLNKQDQTAEKGPTDLQVKTTWKKRGTKDVGSQASTVPPPSHGLFSKEVTSTTETSGQRGPSSGSGQLAPHPRDSAAEASTPWSALPCPARAALLASS